MKKEGKGQIVFDRRIMHTVRDELLSVELEGVHPARVAVDLEQLLAGSDIPHRHGAVSGGGDNPMLVALHGAHGCRVALRGDGDGGGGRRAPCRLYVFR